MDEQDNSECALVAATANADMVAFKNLYGLYEKRVCQYARTFLRDRAAAEDVVLDTMMAVWQGAAKFRGGSRVSTWILGIARHKALDSVRKGSRSAQDTHIDAADQLADSAAGPQESFSGAQSAHLVRRAMATLTPDHNEVLHLVFYEELPYEEIAALLRIPTNTVKTRVYYAKRQLKQAVERLAGSGASR